MALDEQVIQLRIQSCPRLGSLRRINTTFQDLANADQDFTGQIAEIIRRDPSLTSRLLQMVNSVFYGLRNTVSSVEDAVFYLGTKQIRQMALATPVLEDMQQMTSKVTNIDWTHFWQQSIGCAIMSRELLSFSTSVPEGDTDYIAGLIYGVGYLVSVSAFPEQMEDIFQEDIDSEETLNALMVDKIGWSQEKIGAFFLANNNIPKDIQEVVSNQNHPDQAENNAPQATALYIAKRMIGELQQKAHSDSDDVETKPIDLVSTLNPDFRFPISQKPAWDICPEIHTLLANSTDDSMFAIQSLRYTLSQIPSMLKGLV